MQPGSSRPYGGAGFGLCAQNSAAYDFFGDDTTTLPVKNAPKKQKAAKTAKKQDPPAVEVSGLVEIAGGAETADLSHIVAGLRPLAFPLADLVPDAANAREHGDDNVEAIMGSLRQFGQAQAIIAQAGTCLVRAGHGRIEAARRLYAAGDKRWEQVAVLFVDWDNITGVAFAIADNRTAELAEWDKVALEKQLREIAVGDPALQEMYSKLAEDLDLITADDDEGKEGPDKAAARYQIVVTCSDKAHQQELLEQFESDGLDCRAVKA